ncbi:MAG: DUF4338 domain-containing protein [Rhodobacteraceae bacterium]|nr:DUF4338 domain-containing protein [Paracoccaceae bacterium]
MSTLNDEQLDRYQEWLSQRDTEAVDTHTVRHQVEEGLRFAREMTSSEYTLWRTWQQVNALFDPEDKKTLRRIKKVKRNIFVPSSPEDVETIEPELVFVQQQFPIPRVSIWGTERIAFLSNPDPLADDWEIMRHFVSNMEHGGNVGRSMRFLVRDKASKKYLGIICVAGDFAQLKGRDDAIGWYENVKNKGIPDRLNNTAIGSVLVPMQPMGFDFLGGKLMALMSISRPVADMWQRLYADVLAGVTTTSLHASEKEESQYNGLGKYMKSFGRSPGDSALRPDHKSLELMKKWMLYHHPQQYWEFYVAKRDNGQPLRRSANEYARRFCYRQLGIDVNEFRSGHSRGIFFSRLYTNTDAFLRGEIEASKLVPNFDNSVEALTEVWRKKARKRVASLVKKNAFSYNTYFTDGMVGISWDEAKATYLR